MGGCSPHSAVEPRGSRSGRAPSFPGRRPPPPCPPSPCVRLHGPRPGPQCRPAGRSHHVRSCVAPHVSRPTRAPASLHSGLRSRHARGREEAWPPGRGCSLAPSPATRRPLTPEAQSLLLENAGEQPCPTVGTEWAHLFPRRPCSVSPAPSSTTYSLARKAECARLIVENSQPQITACPQTRSHRAPHLVPRHGHTGAQRPPWEMVSLGQRRGSWCPGVQRGDVVLGRGLFWPSP